MSDDNFFDNCFKNIVDFKKDGVVQCPIYPSDDTNGSCPKIVSTDGANCRKTCRDDPTLCYNAALKFCSDPNYTAYGACRCITPSLNTEWKTSSGLSIYASAVGATGSGFLGSAKCAWAACYAGAKDDQDRIPPLNPQNTVFIDVPTIRNCPKNSVLYCAASNSTFSVDTVRANNIDLLSQKCSTVECGAANCGDSVSDGKVGKNSLKTGVIVGSVAAVLIGILIVALVLRHKSGGKYVHRVVVQPTS